MCILCSPPGSRPEIPPPGREGHLPVAQSGEGARKLARWQPTCGVDLQTKDAVYTLSAMTSGIRRTSTCAGELRELLRVPLRRH